jgi:hypothetical protein
MQGGQWATVGWMRLQPATGLQGGQVAVPWGDVEGNHESIICSSDSKWVIGCIVEEVGKLGVVGCHCYSNWVLSVFVAA